MNWLEFRVITPLSVTSTGRHAKIRKKFRMPKHQSRMKRQGHKLDGELTSCRIYNLWRVGALEVLKEELVNY